jgi:hypothetical protein
LAQVAFDFVAVGEGGRELGSDLGHGAKMDRLWGFGEVGPRMTADRVLNPEGEQPTRSAGVTARFPMSMQCRRTKLWLLS